MPSTTTYDRGQIVVVNIPFSDQSGAKLRPALVVSSERFHRALPDVIVVPVSSQLKYYQHPGAGDRPLHHWKAVGLRYPSTARISNIVAVDKTLINRILGTLPADDIERVADGLRQAFAL
jgi:mRNA interferase MazF